MMLVTSTPKFSGASRRERRLWVVLSEWMTRRGCSWVCLGRAISSSKEMLDEVPVGVVVVRGPEDLKDAEVFRDQLPHGRLVAVVFCSDPELLAALQKYSPCFVALNDRDDAAFPDVLERLGRCG